MIYKPIFTLVFPQNIIPQQKLYWVLRRDFFGGSFSSPSPSPALGLVAEAFDFALALALAALALADCRPGLGFSGAFFFFLTIGLQKVRGMCDRWWGCLWKLSRIVPGLARDSSPTAEIALAIFITYPFCLVAFLAMKTEWSRVMPGTG